MKLGQTEKLVSRISKLKLIYQGDIKGREVMNIRLFKVRIHVHIEYDKRQERRCISIGLDPHVYTIPTIRLKIHQHCRSE